MMQAASGAMVVPPPVPLPPQAAPGGAPRKAAGPPDSRGGAQAGSPTSWVDNMTNRMSVAVDALDDNMQSIVRAGLQWALIGAIGGLIIALLSLGGGGPVVKKLLGLIAWPLVIGLAAGSMRWGMIAGFSGNGHVALERLINIGVAPLRFMGTLAGCSGCAYIILVGYMLQLMALFYAFCAYWGSFILAGLPYIVYVLIKKQYQVDWLPFLLMCALGFIPAGIGMFILSLVIT